MIKKLFLILISIVIYANSNCSTIKFIDIPVLDFVYSPKLGKVFGVVSCMDKNYGNCLVQLNYITGEVEKSIFVGSQPNKVKITSDENYVYISFKNIGYIKRINLEQFNIDQEIFLGPADYYKSTILPNDFVIIPHTNNTIVVARHLEYLTADFIDLVMYKNGILQPQKVTNWVTSTIRPRISKVVSNNEGTKLFGYSSETTGGNCYLIDVLNDGVAFNSEYSGIINQFCSIRVYDDTVYARNGVLVDAFSESPHEIIHESLYNGEYNYGRHYGYIYSEIHRSYIYARTDNKDLYFNFYSGINFENIDSVYINLPEYLKSSHQEISNIAIIDKNRFVFNLRVNDLSYKLVFANTELSNDATLKVLSAYGLQMVPEFTPNELHYNVYSPERWITYLSAVPNHGKAIVQFEPYHQPPDIAYVKVTAEDGVSMQEYSIKFNSFETGIEKQLIDTELIIFPNPTNELIYIYSYDKIERISILSSMGFKKTIEDGNLHVINLKNISEGIYFIQVELQNGDILTKKIVKL